MYFNTTHLEGHELSQRRVRARTQEDLVLDFFIKNSSGMFSPDDVLDLVFSRRVPVTSVRRAITNLTTQGLLEKTRYKKPGNFGALTYCWRFKKTS